jgi:DNA-binding CsgD family transcriptional regulator
MTTALQDLLQQAVLDAGAAATDPDRWTGCIAAIGAVTHAAGAALYTHDPARQQGPIAVHGNMAAGSPAYWGHWVHHDPWDHAARKTNMFRSAGEIRLGQEFLSLADYKKTAYFDGHGRAQDSAHKLILQVNDAADPLVPITFLTLTRGFRQEPFGLPEKNLVRRLWPSLRKAIHAQALLRRMPQARDLGEAGIEQLPLPCWVLRSDGRLDFANKQAQGLMHEAAWLGVAAGKLVRMGSLEQAMLRTLLDEAAFNGTSHRLIAYQENLDAPLCRASIRVVSILASPLYAATWPHAQALLMLELPRRDDDPEWIRSLVGPTYALTPNECRVLELLAKGQSVPQIARTLRITSVTVRTHLRGLREKTGRRSQTDLVRLAFGR